jgi:hypothetical protein
MDNKQFEIEKLASDMDFILGDKLKITIAHNEAVSHLVKAKNLFENAGLSKQAEAVDSIMKNVFAEGV